ncbi:MAG: filamentous hemagglutinin N-terminal domain-containing protein [Pseudomonadota bacterium]
MACDRGIGSAGLVAGRPGPLERPARTPLIARLLAGVSASALMVGVASANPRNGTVVGGSATIVQTSPSQLTINQSSERAIINWQSFSIGVGERAVFQQPSSASVALNRVTGVDPSVILGQLSANGHIILINPNGILFGAGSRVDVSSLIATTTNIRNDDFLAGNYNFSSPSSSPTATVVNQGTINVSAGGLAALVAPGVENSGVINAHLGKVALAAANSFTVDFYGDKLINIAVNDKVAQQMIGPDGKPVAAAVTNTGKILGRWRHGPDHRQCRQGRARQCHQHVGRGRGARRIEARRQDHLERRRLGRRLGQRYARRLGQVAG